MRRIFALRTRSRAGVSCPGPGRLIGPQVRQTPTLLRRDFGSDGAAAGASCMGKLKRRFLS